MALVVPYDGSELSKTALVRATQFNTVVGEGVLAVTVVPNNPRYARERGWIQDGETFDRQQVVSRLREQVRKINPAATYEYIGVSRYAQPGEVASKIQSHARKRGASIVFVGSENAGRFTRTVSSVGGTIASGKQYDVLIVSTPGPSKVPKFEAELPTETVLD